MLKSFVSLLGSLLIWLFLPAVNSGSVQLEKTFFDDDYCGIKCENITHTLCPDDSEALCAPHYDTYQIDGQPENIMFLRILVEGHNGLRNRVAERMNVTNMLELTWDTKLAEMAQNFLKRCEEFRTDPCTMHPNIIREEDLANSYYNENKTDPQIAQNSFYEKSNFYPYKFLERMIREWYFEKESMKMPGLKKVSGLRMGRLLGENNFTHFAYPLIHRFGCSMARFNDGYHVLCNYYPYYRTLTNVIYFNSGRPRSECPPHFPLFDHKFTNLCTQDVEDFFQSSINSIHQRSLMVFNCLMTFWFLK